MTCVQDKHVKLIFWQWLTNTSSELPSGATEALKKVTLIGLRSLHNNSSNQKNARQSFYKLHTDLYTVDIAFKSNSGNNIAASLDLSRFEFDPDFDDEEVISQVWIGLFIRCYLLCKCNLNSEFFYSLHAIINNIFNVS